MAKVFISYSRLDQALAEGLRGYLREHAAGSIDVFIDTDIAPGDQFPEAIRAQLETSGFLVVVLPSVASRPMQAEVKFAREMEKQGRLRIIPVLVRSRKPPFEFEMDLAGLQHVELAPERPEVAFEKILEQVMGAAKLEEQFLAAGDDYAKASATFRQLERLPSWRGRARSHMAAFWDRAALRFARAEDRDRSLLAWLEATALEATEHRLREASDLIGEDGAALMMTFRRPAAANPLKSVLGSLFKPERIGQFFARLSQLVPGGAVAISTDRLRIAACWNDCETAFLWKDTGELVATLGHDGPVYTVAISPDGETVATGGYDGTVRLWRSQTGERVGPALEHKSMVTHVAFSPDGQTLGTASGKLAQLWSIPSGEAVAAPLQHDHLVLSLAFEADGPTLATQSLDGLRLWRIGETTAARVNGFESGAVAFDRTLAIAAVVRGLSTHARLKRIPTGESLGPLLVHEGSVKSMAISPGGQELTTGGTDHTARRWQLPTCVPAGPPLRHSHTVTAVGYTADATAAVTQSNDRTVRLWRLNRAGRRQLTMRHDDRITSVCLAPDSRTLVSASDDRTVCIWDVHRGDVAKAVIRLASPAMSVNVTSDGASILTVLKTGGVLIWGLDGEPPTSRSVGPADTSRAALSRDGRTIATAGADNRVRLWRSHTLQQLASLAHESKVTALAFSADGTLVLTGTDDHTAHVWSVQAGEPVGPPLTHLAGVQAIAVSGDSAYAATASGSELRFWQVGTGTPVGEVLKHGGTIVTLQFSSDIKRLICSSRFWLYAYDFDGVQPRLSAARLLCGSLIGPHPIQLGDAEGECVHAALTDSGALFLETLRVSQPDAPPLSGDPEKLLTEWQTRLALSTPLTTSDLMKHMR
jgi:WD40 repeat protein